MAMQTLATRARAATATQMCRVARTPTSTPRVALTGGVQRRKLGSGSSRLSNRFAARAQAKDEIDFDKFLIILAKKWEDADNKGIVVGYSAAAVFLFFFTEWFIHLPVLDLILGFPIQLIGVCTAPYLIVRWFVDNKDWFEDVSAATGTVVDALPGLKKGSADTTTTSTTTTSE